ncbi:MAG TPA: DUF3515 family protein [Mycobacteriales bacterium]|nr:DUF3515 family protein [Mycobacteriales bacterium]
MARRPAVVVATALVVSVVGWQVVESRRTADPVDVSRYPAPAAATSRPCAQFAAALPDSLGSLDRRPVLADHVGWTAYGEPAVVVRCGGSASTRYRPGDQMISINDVAWYADESRAGGVDFSLPRSIVNVSVWIPSAYRADLLSALSGAVLAAQPL